MCLQVLFVLSHEKYPDLLRVTMLVWYVATLSTLPETSSAVLPSRHRIAPIPSL